MMRRPKEGEYHEYYSLYIDLTRGADLLQNLQDSGDRLINLLNEKGLDKGDFSYEKGKWTIKQLLRHIIDTDLVFIYRIVAIARKDKSPLPGYEQDNWAENASLENIELNDLMEEFTLLRRFIIRTIKGLGDDDLDQLGTASGNPSSSLAIAYMIAGHSFHHCNILEERYL